MPEYIYCDESLSEAFVNPRQGSACLAIGGLWVTKALVPKYRDEIRRLRELHGVFGEMKWRKVTPASQEFYLDLARLFFAADQELRFRAIVVPTAGMDLTYHGNDPELGFYKFYYQMLVHRLSADGVYRVFCDERPDRDPGRIRDLERCLRAKSHAQVDVQALPSSQVVLMQMCDVLLGAVSAKFNRTEIASEAKRSLVEEIESSIGHEIRPTYPSESKFNIFQIQPGFWSLPGTAR